MSATDGTNTSTQTIQPDNINLSSTDGTTTSSLEFDPTNSYNGTRIKQESSLGSTSMSFAEDQSFWIGENLSSGEYGESMISSTQGYTVIYDTTGNNYGGIDNFWNNVQLRTYSDVLGDNTSLIEILNNTNIGQINLSTYGDTGATTYTKFEMDPAGVNVGNVWEANTDTGIKDSLVLDPKQNFGNSEFRSEDIINGGYSVLSMTYDNPSFECSDGAGLGVGLTLANTTIVLNSQNGTDTQNITFDNSINEINMSVSDTSSYGRVGLTTTNSYLQLDDDGNTYVGSVDFTYNTFVNNTINGVLSTGSMTGSSQSLVTTFTNLDTDTGFVSLQSTDGVDTNVITILPSITNFSNVPAFDDDTAASGLTTGDIYQTTGGGASPLDVAGILMIKQ
jgi:hypothetical protein